MDTIDRLESSKTVYWLAFALAGFVLAYILVGQAIPGRTQAPDPAYMEQRAEAGVPVQARSVYLDPDSPCSVERYELAMSRWADEGWDPGYITTDRERADMVVSGREDLLPEDEVMPDGAVKRVKAATGTVVNQGRNRLYLVVRFDDVDKDGTPDACDEDSAVIEHDIGHALYALEHVYWPSGWVMNETTNRIGLRIPRPTGDEDAI